MSHRPALSRLPATVNSLPVDSIGLQTLQKGMLLRFKKEIPQAIEVLEKAYQQFETEQQPLGMAMAAVELAWLHGNARERTLSENWFDITRTSLETVTEETAAQELHARLKHYQGLLCYHTQDYGQALRLFKEALTYAPVDSLECAKIYDSLGVHYERTGDFHRALRYLQLALVIKTRMGGPLFEEAITCQILGRLYVLYEEYETALDYLERAYTISTKLKDEKRRIALCNERIRLFIENGTVDQAQALIEKTIQTFKSRYLKIPLNMTRFYQAALAFHQQDYEATRTLLTQDILPIFEKFQYRKGKAHAKRLLARTLGMINPENSIEPVALIGEAIELFRRENMIEEVAKSYLALGHVYLGRKKLTLATTSILDALKVAESNGFYYMMAQIEDALFEINPDKWQEVVNKRACHERIFEKRYSLVEDLARLAENPEQNPVHADREEHQDIPYLLSLLRVGQALASEHNLDKMLQVVKTETERALTADRCTVFLYDEDANELWSRVASGLEETTEIRFSASSGLAGYAVKTGEIVNVRDAYADPRFNINVDKQTGYRTHNMLCVPMRNRRGKIMGVFQVLNKASGAFEHRDEELLVAIASMAGMALENARLYGELKRTFDSFIETLSSAIDARDPITAGHSERVMAYSLLIGENLHLPEKEMEALKYAALLHDIGKIGIHDDVLAKEGRLTENEYRHIQEHVRYTHEILSNIHFERDLACIPEIAASHHEKVDGSGYFRGLKGDDIHIGGRILAVADVFDAITSKRQYRNRMPFDRVIGILKNDAGKHFDLDIVEAFLDVSLKRLTDVLCQDPNVKADPMEVQAGLHAIPASLTIRAYLAGLANANQEIEAIHALFERLYHFNEVSDWD